MLLFYQLIFHCFCVIFTKHKFLVSTKHKSIKSRYLLIMCDLDLVHK